MGQATPLNPRRRLSQKERASRPAFEDRVSQAARELEEKAICLPPGPERDDLLRRARLMDVAKHIDKWLSSPGLRSPE
jgi:hypothetical protein